MRKRLGTLVAVSALVFAACGGTTATVAPSAVSSAPATTPPSTAPTPVPSQAPIPIDITATSYKPEAVGNRGGTLVIGISGDADSTWPGIYSTYANTQEAFGVALWGLWSNTSDLKYYGQL